MSNTNDELDKVRMELGELFEDPKEPEYCLVDLVSDKMMGQVAKYIKANYRHIDDIRVTGETSDGYHTFNELYEYRKAYNALLFNEWYQTKSYGIHKSKRHSDGKLCFGGGWFVVVAGLPTGQVTNHYELKDWDLFKVEERHKAIEYDGHTPQEALERLRQALSIGDTSED